MSDPDLNIDPGPQLAEHCITVLQYVTDWCDLDT